MKRATVEQYLALVAAETSSMPRTGGQCDTHGLAMGK
jgi:hypothetical protein